MALRRVSALRTPHHYTTGLTTANQLLRNAIVEMPGVAYSGSATEAAQNPFGFTQYQLQNGFQAANTIGRQYAQFDEAPMGYISEHPVFGSDYGSSYNFDTMYGMLGSLVGPHVRQALDTPITRREPITGSVVNGENSIDIGLGIDWALGEKQATFGTPEYFRKMYRDTLPTDPGSYGLGLALASPSAYYDAQRTYENRYGTPISYKSPGTAASQALSGGYQNGVMTRVEQIERGGMYENIAYMNPDAAAVHKSVYRPNETFLGTGTGDFRGPAISMRAVPTVSGTYDMPAARSAFQPESRSERTVRSLTSQYQPAPAWQPTGPKPSTTSSSIQSALSHSWNYSANPDIDLIRRYW